MRGTPLERLLAKAEVPPSWSACWRWIGAGNPKGYGQIVRDGRLRQAHRVAYELAIGPIPDGLVLDHLCRNRGCINPLHLEPVTSKENTHRGVGTNAAKTHCPRGHEYTETNTYRWPGAPGSSRQCRACRPSSEE